MMKKKYITYQMKQRYGMESVGDTYYEYMTPEEILEDNKRHSAYIDDCKLKEIYGKEYIVSMKLEHDPLYDDRLPQKSCESYRMDIINLSDIKL